MLNLAVMNAEQALMQIMSSWSYSFTKGNFWGCLGFFYWPHAFNFVQSEGQKRCSVTD